jgi:hypothetical protein
MSEPLGSYAFLSWLRTGVSTGIARTDGAGPAAPRAAVDLALTLNTGPAQVSLALYGPGDVTGLDPRVVIRTWPRPGVVDAEANYFPLIEFAQADLPWRYTPARASAEDRLRPWIILAVLADDEIDRETPSVPGRPLSSIVVKDVVSLPGLGQSWAWAHVQVSGVTTLDPGQAAELLAREPARALSRLLCPRRLKDRARYRGFLVPAFERGRLAGLGQAVPDDLDGLHPAWQDGARNIELPVYYAWRFETGPAGDFEALVRLLRPRPLPPTVGIRAMDVSEPGSELPAAARGPLGLEGALRTPATESTPWPVPERSGWTTALRSLLNRAAELLRGTPERPLVGPPLYGRWHAARDTLEPGQEPVWFQELNADPRLRATAGLGTLVVQDQQRQLVASAWQQVERIRRLNDELRRAQLAREVALRLMTRHVRTAGLEGVLQLSAPVHGLIRGSPVTVRALLRRSAIAVDALQGQFRRVARPLGPVERRLGRPRASVASTILARMNRSELSPAPPPPLPGTMVTPGRVADRAAGGTSVRPGVISSGAILARGVTPAAMTGFAGAPGRVAPGSAVLTADSVTGAPIPARFDPAEHDVGPGGVPRPRGRPPAGRPDAVRLAAARRFQAAAAEAVQDQAAPLPATPVVAADLAALHATVLAALDPRVTVGASLRQRVRIAPGILWQPADPLEAIMAAPVFDQPMYEPLAELSQDWILPGLDAVPPNTVSLLLTNQRVIEAYMVGLNHEMSRELLWHEYPTDMRGTYFRQFWDVSGYVPPPGESLDPETLRDIRPIHLWPKGARLGGNTSRRPPPGGEHLVLLVRGELLRRYPNSTVYAVRAKPGAQGRELDTEERHPVFSGRLRPDVAFFGFELSVEEARGVAEPDGPQGWFFVIQEQPSEPRFGLDVDGTAGQPVASWDALSWKSLVPSDAALADLGHIDLTAALPDTAAAEAAPPHAVWHAAAGAGGRGARASDLAYITLQQPVRIAWHAANMLPG